MKARSAWIVTGALGAVGLTGGGVDGIGAGGLEGAGDFDGLIFIDAAVDPVMRRNPH